MNARYMNTMFKRGHQQPAVWSDLVTFIKPSEGLSNVCQTESGKAVRAVFKKSTLTVSIEFAPSINYVLENRTFPDSETLLTVPESLYAGATISLIDGKLYLVVQYCGVGRKPYIKDCYVDTTGEGHNFTFLANMHTYNLTDPNRVYSVSPCPIISKLSNGALCSPFYTSYYNGQQYATVYNVSMMTHSLDGGQTWTVAAQYRIGGGYIYTASGNLVETADGYALWRVCTNGGYHAYHKDALNTEIVLDTSEPTGRRVTIAKFGPSFYRHTTNKLQLYSSPAEATCQNLINTNNWTDIDTAAENTGFMVMQAFPDMLIASSDKSIKCLIK